MDDITIEPMNKPTAYIGPILARSLSALRTSFNIAFPARDTHSDGWKGDPDHYARISGHNPDDTPGVRAEYSDADAIPEVRAIDVDADLRTPGVTMQDVIDRILDTPQDRLRLRYIIYAETIWSASADWDPRHYDGDNPHTAHAHFSGDPEADDDAAVWSVIEMGEDMYTPDQHRAFAVQYDGRGIGENDGATIRRSLLSYFDEMLKTLRRVDEALAEMKEHMANGSSPHTHTTGPAIPDTSLED